MTNITITTPTMEQWLDPKTKRHVRLSRIFDDQNVLWWYIELYMNDVDTEACEWFGHGETIELAFAKAFDEMIVNFA